VGVLPCEAGTPPSRAGGTASREAARGQGGQSDLANPGLNGITIWSDIGGRLDRIAAEQLSCPVKQCAHLVQLLLQPGISHVLDVTQTSLLPQFTATHYDAYHKNRDFAGQSDPQLKVRLRYQQEPMAGLVQSRKE
jgi:hypothetical protein